MGQRKLICSERVCKLAAHVDSEDKDWSEEARQRCGVLTKMNQAMCKKSEAQPQRQSDSTDYYPREIINKN